MKEVSADRLIEVYLQLRSRKEAIEREAKEAVAEVTTTMQEIEGLLTGMVDNIGAESLKTDKGTAFFKSTDYARVEDKGTFMQFVREQEQFDLLEVRPAKMEVRRYIDENDDLVPGVTYGHVRKIHVRKP